MESQLEFDEESGGIRNATLFGAAEEFAFIGALAPRFCVGSDFSPIKVT